jgi:hypothetical protein
MQWTCPLEIDLKYMFHLESWLLIISVEFGVSIFYYLNVILPSNGRPMVLCKQVDSTATVKQDCTDDDVDSRGEDLCQNSAQMIVLLVSNLLC